MTFLWRPVQMIIVYWRGWIPKIIWTDRHYPGYFKLTDRHSVSFGSAQNYFWKGTPIQMILHMLFAALCYTVGMLVGYKASKKYKYTVTVSGATARAIAMQFLWDGVEFKTRTVGIHVIVESDEPRLLELYKDRM